MKYLKIIALISCLLSITNTLFGQKNTDLLEEPFEVSYTYLSLGPGMNFNSLGFNGGMGISRFIGIDIAAVSNVSKFQFYQGVEMNILLGVLRERINKKKIRSKRG